MNYQQKISTAFKIKQLRNEMKCQVCLFGEELNRERMSLFCKLKKSGVPYQNEVRCRDFVDKYKLPTEEQLYDKETKQLELIFFDEHLK